MQSQQAVNSSNIQLLFQLSKCTDPSQQLELVEQLSQNLDHIEHTTCHQETILLSVFDQLFPIFSSKDKRKYTPTYEIQKTILKKINPWLCFDMVNIIVKHLTNNPLKGMKEYCYKLLNILIKNCSLQIPPV